MIKGKIPNGHKNGQKDFTAGQFFPPKKIQNEHTIGMVTPLDIPIHPVACSP